MEQGGHSREQHRLVSHITTPNLCFGCASSTAARLLPRSWQLVGVPGHFPKAAVTYASSGATALSVGASALSITQAVPGDPGICSGSSACGRGGTRMAHCFELTSRGVFQDPLADAHKLEGLIPKAGDTSQVPHLSLTSWEWLGRTKAPIQPGHRGTVQLIIPGLCLLGTPD